MIVPYGSILLSSRFTEKAAAAASVLVMKGAFAVVVKKGEIMTDTSLNKNQLGILYACDAGILNFSYLFLQTLMISITY